MLEPIAFKIPTAPYEKRLCPPYQIHDCSESFDHLGPATTARIKVLVTAGFVGASAADMDRLPNLGLVCCIGTGFENVDLDAARARGILVTHGAGINAGAVADQAMGMLIGIVRRIPQQDRKGRAGGWRYDEVAAPMFSSKTIGIYGLGGIGQAVARRAAGFDLEILYHSRSERRDLPYRYMPSLIALAEACDYLVCTVPGGAETFHMVDGPVLDALGAKGFVVNVGRGSIVDTQALITALTERRIGGAALDVYETEPEIPPALRALDNVVLTLHTAGVATETQDLSAKALIRNVDAFLEGRPVLTPVPPMKADLTHRIVA